MSIVFFNGNFIPEKEALLPITDRGFLFGDGIFTTMKVKEGFIEAPDSHLNLLQSQCRILHLTPPKIKNEWLRELVVQNMALKGVWRLKIIVTGGSSSDLNLAPRPPGQLLMTLKPYTENVQKSYRLIDFPYSVLGPSTRIKSLSYLDRLWIKDFARTREYDDALVFSQEGFLLETAFSNIFWRKNDELFIPDPALSHYQGSTIAFVKKAAEKIGMTVYFVQATYSELPDEGQFFICNSMRGICPAFIVVDKFFERDLNFEHRLGESFRHLISKSSLKCHPSS